MQEGGDENSCGPMDLSEGYKAGFKYTVPPDLNPPFQGLFQDKRCVVHTPFISSCW